MRITIPLTPITKKNSQRIIWNNRAKRPMIIPSAQYKEYEKAAEEYMQTGCEPINTPVNVQMVFTMPTRRRVDLVNLQESCLDILVKYGVLADDNSNIVAAMDGSRVEYEKGAGKTEITITDIMEE